MKAVHCMYTYNTNKHIPVVYVIRVFSFCMSCILVRKTNERLFLRLYPEQLSTSDIQDICSRFQEDCMPSPPLQAALQTLTIVGVVLSLIGIVLTVFTLLFLKWVKHLTLSAKTVFILHACLAIHFVYTSPLYRKFRKRVVTIFHVQLCIALFCLLIIFLCGIDKTAVYGGCVAVSALIHYFTLVSVMLMGAEAVLMFQKLVIVFGSTSTKFFITVSLICWRKCVRASHLH